ncbi:unnamed protein product [Prorocentrum cordatum]|uniref:F-box domain-containing protein n=1 Tax=Prorocentrum cordatum TaxID=2364126 RepID=A0ABN9RMF7_9DINO|nr:unnamed protein product [Polarella glacialis]
MRGMSFPAVHLLGPKDPPPMEGAAASPSPKRPCRAAAAPRSAPAERASAACDPLLLLSAAHLDCRTLGRAACASRQAHRDIMSDHLWRSVARQQWASTLELPSEALLCRGHFDLCRRRCELQRLSQSGVTRSRRGPIRGSTPYRELLEDLSLVVDFEVDGRSMFAGVMATSLIQPPQDRATLKSSVALSESHLCLDPPSLRGDDGGTLAMENIKVPRARLSLLLFRRSTGRFMVVCCRTPAEIPWWSGVLPDYDKLLQFFPQAPRFCVRYPMDDIFYPGDRDATIHTQEVLLGVGAGCVDLHVSLHDWHHGGEQLLAVYEEMGEWV